VLTLVAEGDKADVDEAVEAACALTVARQQLDRQATELMIPKD
jgi:hypothetical protein